MRTINFPTNYGWLIWRSGGGCRLPGRYSYSHGYGGRPFSGLGKIFLNSNNLRLSKNKCEILTDKLEFLGHTLSSKGISPIESKVKALIDTPIPGNVKILHSFLGLVNYYAKFLPHLSERIRLMFSLIRKGSEWLWCEEYAK